MTDIPPDCAVNPGGRPTPDVSDIPADCLREAVVGVGRSQRRKLGGMVVARHFRRTAARDLTSRGTLTWADWTLTVQYEPTRRRLQNLDGHKDEMECKEFWPEA